MAIGSPIPMEYLCVLYSMLKVWALLLDSGISIIHTMNITRPLWGNIYGAECSKQVEARVIIRTLI